MFIRDHSGKMIEVDIKKYNSEMKMYSSMWEKMFGVKIEKPECIFNKIVNRIKKTH
jgi:hypothetical protein